MRQSHESMLIPNTMLESRVMAQHLFPVITKQGSFPMNDYLKGKAESFRGTIPACFSKTSQFLIDWTPWPKLYPYGNHHTHEGSW